MENGRKIYDVKFRLCKADKEFLDELCDSCGYSVSGLMELYVRMLRQVRPYVGRYHVRFVVESAFGSVLASDMEAIPTLHQEFLGFQSEDK